ncbi:MAG: hypothetical protein PVI89_00590 [Desulfobacteraceae bacterium]
MPKKNRPASTAPAKVTPPRLGACYLRKGLFKKLDHYRDKPALWTSGPAGSGKTMLAASYLQDRLSVVSGRCPRCGSGHVFYPIVAKVGGLQSQGGKGEEQIPAPAHP